jgi:hypothetical protein
MIARRKQGLAVRRTERRQFTRLAELDTQAAAAPAITEILRPRLNNPDQTIVSPRLWSCHRPPSNLRCRPHRRSNSAIGSTAGSALGHAKNLAERPSELIMRRELDQTILLHRSQRRRLAQTERVRHTRYGSAASPRKSSSPSTALLNLKSSTLARSISHDRPSLVAASLPVRHSWVTQRTVQPKLAATDPASTHLEVRRRLARLQERIRDQCPGEHRYVAHGDGKLPWCDHCGFTDAGLHRTENGMSHSNDGHHLSDDDLYDGEED